MAKDIFKVRNLKEFVDIKVSPALMKQRPRQYKMDFGKHKGKFVGGVKRQCFG